MSTKNDGIVGILFLDRDGIVNEDKGYVSKKEDITFVPGIFDVIESFHNWGYKVVIVTNQSGIGRGYIPLEDFQEIMKYIYAVIFARTGAKVSFEYAPAVPDSKEPDRQDRKPMPMMFFKAINKIFDPIKGEKLSEVYSWNHHTMIGDKYSDMLAAQRAGIHARMLVRSRYTEEQEPPAELNMSAVEIFNSVKELAAYAGETI